MDPKLFFKTIIPILSMKNTCLLCLSSPEGDSNYYSQLMNLKREGSDENFFNVIECFKICKACRKLDRVTQIKCDHIKNTAHWLSQPKMTELKTLYKASPEDAIREFGGIVISDHMPALVKDHVMKAFSLPVVDTVSTPPMLITTCDPSGAGPSMLSISTGYQNAAGEFVVSNLDPAKGRIILFSFIYDRLCRSWLQLCRSWYPSKDTMLLPARVLHAPVG